MKLIKLNCPACAAALELPDNLTIAHCVYCGNKILLDQDGVVQEHRDLERYIELCRVAMEAKNFPEAVRYCTLILEIDPKNVGAWLDKAISTFWLTTDEHATTGAHNSYREALVYINRAEEIAANDSRVPMARDLLAKQEARWLNQSGAQQYEYGMKVFELPPAYWKQAQAHVINAMNYYLMASDLDPDNIAIIENIAIAVNNTKWIKWSEKVYAKISSLEKLRAQEKRQ